MEILYSQNFPMTWKLYFDLRDIIQSLKFVLNNVKT